MARAGSLILGIGLGVSWLIALAAGLLGWLTWLDFVAMVAAFAVAAVADESERRALEGGGGEPVYLDAAAAGMLAIALYALWIVGISTGAPPWLAWWNFLFASGFLFLALAVLGARRGGPARHPRDLGSRVDPDGLEPGLSPAADGPYRGRGPRNFTRSDRRVLEDVCDRLLLHPELDASDLEVGVAQGVVRLSGNVSRRSERRLAEALAATVPGVRGVQSDLAVGRRTETAADPRPVQRAVPTASDCRVA